jgi:hypothetical protein
MSERVWKPFMLRQGFPEFIEGLNAVWRMFGFVMTQYALQAGRGMLLRPKRFTLVRCNDSFGIANPAQLGVH